MFKIIILFIVLVGNFNFNEACLIDLPIGMPNSPTTTVKTTIPKLVIDTVILTSEEIENLQNITGYRGSLKLLYRATRDSFAALAFHSKCNGKANTITIIKSTLNFVFGGYTSADWTRCWMSDSSAYLFSLRVNGSATALKYPVVSSSTAICGSLSYGPLFGSGYDIQINNYPNLYTSYTYCSSYQCPSGVNRYSYHSKFAGATYFKVTEIEVFQMN